MTDPHGSRGDVADVLAKRRDLLAAVVDEPRDKRDLVDGLSTPRSTLDRGIRELEAAGLVEFADGVYRPTLFGRTALETHDRYLRTVGDLADASAVTGPLPADSPLGRTFLEGARVSPSEPHAPDTVLDRLFESVDDAEEVRGVAPVALTGHTDAFRERAVAGDGRLEVVLSPAVFETLSEVDGAEMAEAIETGEVAFRRGPVPFEFGLWIADGEAGVVVYTGTGVSGVLVNDGPDAVAWASDLYDRVRASSVAVDADEVRRRTVASD